MSIFTNLIAKIFTGTKENMVPVVVDDHVQLRQEKGSVGEVNVDASLAYLNHDEYKIISNGLFKLREGVTVQIDHIVVSRAGIFVIETKNYGGIIVSDNDRWQQIWHAKRFSFYSPKKQNESHIKSLMYILFTKRRDLFHSVVVFPENADLHIDNTTGVVKNNGLCRYIMKHQRHLMSHDEMQRLYNQLVAKNIYTPENARLHRERVRELYG